MVIGEEAQLLVLRNTPFTVFREYRMHWKCTIHIVRNERNGMRVELYAKIIM